MEALGDIEPWGAKADWLRTAMLGFNLELSIPNFGGGSKQVKLAKYLPVDPSPPPTEARPTDELEARAKVWFVGMGGTLKG